jgi:hypothetical protein
MPAATTLRNLVPWLPTAVAVGFLLVSLVTVATVAVRGDAESPVPVRAAPPVLQSFAPQTPSPAPSSAPSATPRGEGAIGVAEPPRTGPSRVPEAQRSTPERARTSSAAPAPSTGKGPTGTYRVLDSFDGGFIGEVLITNPARTETGWTVTLTMPETITGLVTSWVEGAPQATLDVDGRTYTWRSGVPEGAGSSVPLRFHVNRDGGPERPARCTVNGTSCSGLT